MTEREIKINQPPLFLSDDAKAILDRIKHTYPGAGWLEMKLLFTCWRPPGPRGRPWSERRVFAAIEECEAAGVIRRREVFSGDILEIVPCDR